MGEWSVGPGNAHRLLAGIQTLHVLPISVPISSSHLQGPSPIGCGEIWAPRGSPQPIAVGHYELLIPSTNAASRALWLGTTQPSKPGMNPQDAACSHLLWHNLLDLWLHVPIHSFS